jgi:hypothetical protein
MAYDANTETAAALLGDSTLQSIQAMLRQKVGLVLDNPGSYRMLSDVGISTSGKSSDLTLIPRNLPVPSPMILKVSPICSALLIQA